MKDMMAIMASLSRTKTRRKGADEKRGATAYETARHLSPSIVELPVPLSSDGGRIDSGEVDGGEDNSGEVATLRGRVERASTLVALEIAGVSALASRSHLHVVDALGLGDHLGEKDGKEDLGGGLEGVHVVTRETKVAHLSLASIGDSVPGIEGLHGREGLEGDTGGELAGEVEAGALDEVAGGGKHSNAAVLELGSAEPEEGLL